MSEEEQSLARRRSAIMLRFEGDRDFPRTPAELFAHLNDARFLVECIPDVESVSNLAPDQATLILRPGFSFVRGTLEVTLQIVDSVPPISETVRLHSKGIGSSSEVEAALTLSEHEGGARVHWVAEIKSLGGLLKMIPPGLARGAAEKVINDAWNKVREKLPAT
jgi:carbon monoxide dehydrogenase subunit G